jgi:hypothetical protein
MNHISEVYAQGIGNPIPYEGSGLHKTLSKYGYIHILQYPVSPIHAKEQSQSNDRDFLKPLKSELIPQSCRPNPTEAVRCEVSYFHRICIDIEEKPTLLALVLVIQQEYLEPRNR